MRQKTSPPQGSNKWEANVDVFEDWVKGKERYLSPGFTIEPTIKVLIFLVLLDSDEDCTYAEIKRVFREKGVVVGTIPDNTLRTSVLSLAKSLDKAQHPFELQSERGKFKLIKRTKTTNEQHNINESPIILSSTTSSFPEKIAKELIEKSRIPFHSLYFLEWSARWWEIFSHDESQIRVDYEVESWEKLGSKQRVLKNPCDTISIVGLAPGEGLSEITLIKKILDENPSKKIHYVAVDLSQRLLRQHINLLQETVASDIKKGRVICAGISADIFNDFSSSIESVKNTIFSKSKLQNSADFLPKESSLLVTYFGNCLGNHYQDQEIEVFSIIQSAFENRPLEFLVGVSVMRSSPDQYKRNWDDFLLLTPKHLMESKGLLESSRPDGASSLPEFSLPDNDESNDRCPSVEPELYTAQHGIKGHIYRFYYKLEHDLKLISSSAGTSYLPAGSLVLLYNIIKYDMRSLVNGITKSGVYSVRYDENHHKLIDTSNGVREYAVFCAYIEG